MIKFEQILSRTFLFFSSFALSNLSIFFKKKKSFNFFVRFLYFFAISQKFVLNFHKKFCGFYQILQFLICVKSITNWIGRILFEFCMIFNVDRLW